MALLIDYNLEVVLDTAAVLSVINPVLQLHQLGRETDSKLFKVGDGVTPWNTLEYANSNNTNTTFTGPSSQSRNLLGRSNQDGGLVLLQDAFNAEDVLTGVLNGTYTMADRPQFTLSQQHKLISLLLSIYVKRLTEALGSNFADLLTPAGYTGNTVQAQLASLQTAVNNVDQVVTGVMKDNVSATTSTWSSSKIASEITTAVQALRTQLVGNAGDALDTIYELAQALTNNSNYISTILSELAQAVKFVPQTLTAAQAQQARTNILAASADLLGNYSQIGNQSLEEKLGVLPTDPGTGTPTSLEALAQDVQALNLKTAVANCSMYRSDQNATTRQYRQITWKRTDGSVAARSILWNESPPGSGLCTRRTETVYGGDGTTVLKEIIWTINYDSDRAVASEVITSVNSVLVAS